MLTRDLSPAAPTGPVRREPDEGPDLRHLHVHAALWEAVGLLLVPRPGVHCGVLGWEGGVQVTSPVCPARLMSWVALGTESNDANGARLAGSGVRGLVRAQSREKEGRNKTDTGTVLKLREVEKGWAWVCQEPSPRESVASR